MICYVCVYQNKCMLNCYAIREICETGPVQICIGEQYGNDLYGKTVWGDLYGRTVWGDLYGNDLFKRTGVKYMTTSALVVRGTGVATCTKICTCFHTTL